MVVGLPGFGLLPVLLPRVVDLPTAALALVVYFLVALGVVLWVVLAWMRRHALRPADIGWRRPAPARAYVAAVVLGLAWAALGLAGFAQARPGADLLEIGPLRIAVAVVAVAGAAMEDFVTRGFVMTRLQQAGARTWAQATISSAVFALYHSLGPLALASFIPSFVYGLLLAGIYVLGRRSLMPVIAAHGLTLAIAEPFLTMYLIVTSSRA